MLVLAFADTKITQKSLHDTKKGRYELNLHWVELSPKSAVNDLANKLIKSAVMGDIAEFKIDAMEPGYKPVAPWEHEVGCTVSMATPNLVSVLIDTYNYSGGAHPNGWTEVVNVALIGGQARQLTLKDLLAPGVTESDVLDVIVLPRANAAKRERGMDEIDTLPEETNRKFVISKYGLAFPFDKYAIGAYAEGEYLVKIPWRDMKGLVNPKVIPFAVP